MKRVIARVLLVVAGAASGCELAEVAAPASADVLVVEGLLRVGARQQYVLLHRSMIGEVVRGEPGARVSVSGPDGGQVIYEEVQLADCVRGNLTEGVVAEVQVEASCYLSPPETGRFVQPGATYELLIETAGGGIARGRTVVPTATEFRTPAVAVDPQTRIARCTLPSRPFTLTWTRAEGAWAYITSLQLSDWGDELREQGVEVPDPLELTGVSVSAADTTLLFPENMGLFQRADFDQRIFAALRGGLPEGADAIVAILAADRNYTNAIRGGRFNPSGNVRASSVVGDAVGVFGSVVPLLILSLPDEDAASPCPVHDGPEQGLG